MRPLLPPFEGLQSFVAFELEVFSLVDLAGELSFFLSGFLSDFCSDSDFSPFVALVL